MSLLFWRVSDSRDLFFYLKEMPHKHLVHHDWPQYPGEAIPQLMIAVYLVAATRSRAVELDIACTVDIVLVLSKLSFVDMAIGQWF